MKKLLSVILAGALALTAVSPVLASTSNYYDTTAEILYYEKDFSDYKASSGLTIADYITGVYGDSNIEQVVWKTGATATIEPIEDTIKGTVARVTATAADTPIRFASGFTEYNLADFEANGTTKGGALIFEFTFLDEGTGSDWYVRNRDVIGSGNIVNFWGDGTGNVNGQSGTDFTYNVGEWNHGVVVLRPYRGSTGKANFGVDFHLNGKFIGSTSASSKRQNIANEVWNDDGKAGIRLETGAVVQFGEMRKYQRDTTTNYKTAGQGYVAATAGDVASAITPADADKVTMIGSTIYYDPSMTIGELDDALTKSNNGSAAFVYVDGETEYLADEEQGDYEAALSDLPVTKIVAMSQSGDVYTYYEAEAKAEEEAALSSSVYTVNPDNTITGVLQFTTPAQFVANVTDAGGTPTLSTTGTYVAEGDTVTATDGKVYTIKLDDSEAHHDGTAVAMGNFVATAISNNVDYVAEKKAVDDALRNSKVLKIKSAAFRYDNPTKEVYAEVRYIPVGTLLEVGEKMNAEFAVKAEGLVEGGLSFDGNYIFSINGENNIGVDKGADSTSIGTFVLNEWQHFVVSVWRDTVDTFQIKVYQDGKLIYEGAPLADTKTDGTFDHNNQIDLSFKGAGTTQQVVYYDDIKYYNTESWVFDAVHKYGAGDISSTSADITVANNEVWLANEDVAIEGFGDIDAVDSTGTAVTLSELAVGDTFYVRTSPIIKKYTVKAGTFGTAIVDYGTFVATVGMIDDSRKVSLFVAEYDAEDKISAITKIGKTNPTDDEIVVELWDYLDNEVEKVKIYVWDSSLTSLTDVAVCTYDSDYDEWTLN